MNFLITNTEIDNKIAGIKRKIKLSMNGVTSDSMHINGIIYKQNYGVAIPRLREIAREYAPNHDLAQRLWLLKIRETMILASLLEEPEKFKYENALQWLGEIDQIELVEQCVMNIFVKTNFANELISETIVSQNLWQKVTGFMMAARLYNNISPTLTNTVIQKAFEYSVSDEFHLYKSIALCMSRLCRRNKETADHITSLITQHFDDKNDAQRYIAEEVRQEILFLND